MTSVVSCQVYRYRKMFDQIYHIFHHKELTSMAVFNNRKITHVTHSTDNLCIQQRAALTTVQKSLSQKNCQQLYFVASFKNLQPVSMSRDFLYPN